MTKALDFFQEPKKEVFPGAKRLQRLESNESKNDYDEVEKMAEFLDRLGTLDVLETEVIVC